MPKLLIKFASRSRPEKFFAALDNIFSLIGYEDYTILVTLDGDDSTMNASEVIERLNRLSKVVYSFGTSKNKIHAINRDMNLVTDWVVCIVMSDDMEFVYQDFGKEIMGAMERAFPDYDGVLHYPDKNNLHTITLSILGKKYFDRFGYLYHPDYTSVKADKEFGAVAQKLHKVKFVDKIIFNHHHPRWGADWDELYKQNESTEMYATDQKVFLKRKEMNFGL